MEDQGRSIAVWHKPTTQNSDKARAELHVNFWHFKTGFWNFLPCIGEKYDGFLDIGLMLYDLDKLGNINISIPVKLEPSDIVDLGAQFREASIATAIFNENLAQSHDSINDCADLNLGESLFARVCWLTESDFTKVSKYIEYQDGRTILQIPKSIVEERNLNWPAITVKENRLYFRFRFKLRRDKNSPFMQRFRPWDRLITSSHDLVEYLDFRFNRIRNLPKNIRKEIFSNSFMFEKINFFIISSIENDVVNGYKTFDKIRILEEDVWSKYLDKKIETNMVIYQWKEDKTKEDLSAFVKFRTRKTGILTYLIFVVFLAFLTELYKNFGNILSSLIQLLTGR